MTTRRPLVVAAVCAALAATSACRLRRYEVNVRFKPEAADRRLARGQSDVVTGRLERADGVNVYVNSGGSSEPIPLADIGEVDQAKAKRDVRWGAGFAIGGTLLAVVSAFYFDCGANDFPVFCAFQSEANFWAGVSFIGGVALAGAGLGAIFSGKADQSRNAGLLRDAGLREASWWIAPTPVPTGGGAAPGLGAGVRF